MTTPGVNHVGKSVDFVYLQLLSLGGDCRHTKTSPTLFEVRKTPNLLLSASVTVSCTLLKLWPVE